MSVVGIANWGPLVISSDIDDHVLAAVKTWMPTYLKQIYKERNLTVKPALPRTYAATFMGQEFLDHQLPAIIATTAQSTAMVGGSNMLYDGVWSLRLATVLRAKRPPVTRYLASLYEGVVRRLVLQQARGGPCNDIKYAGMRYEEVPDVTGAGRYCLAAISTFDIFTDAIVQPYAGPDVPDADVYLDEATITEVDIEVLGDMLSITS